MSWGNFLRDWRLSEKIGLVLVWEKAALFDIWVGLAVSEAISFLPFEVSYETIELLVEDEGTQDCPSDTLLDT